jgi:hypothetical protein
LLSNESEQEMFIREIVDHHWVIALGSIFSEAVFDSCNDLSIDSFPKYSINSMFLIRIKVWTCDCLSNESELRIE